MAKKILFLFACLYFSLPALLFSQATDPQKNYTAFEMRSNGKIYVVVSVMLIIFAGIVLYLVRLDRKMTRLEKEKL